MRSKAIKREELLTVRMSTQVHGDFKVVAELRGLSMSALVHQFAVAAIREEKNRDLSGFSLVQKRQQAENGQDSSDTGPVLRFEKPVKKPKLRPRAKRKLGS